MIFYLDLNSTDVSKFSIFWFSIASPTPAIVKENLIFVESPEERFVKLIAVTLTLFPVKKQGLDVGQFPELPYPIVIRPSPLIFMTVGFLLASAYSRLIELDDPDNGLIIDFAFLIS